MGNKDDVFANLSHIARRAIAQPQAAAPAAPADVGYCQPSRPAATGLSTRMLASNPQLSWLRSGSIETVGSFRPSHGEVMQLDRDDYLSCPAYAFYNMFARCAQISPNTNLVAEGTKQAGNPLALTVSAAAAVGTGPGNMVLTPGFIIECSVPENDVGICSVDVAGMNEDGQVFTMTGVEFATLENGLAAFWVFGTRVVSGKTYPVPILIRNDYKLTDDGVAIPLTAGAPPNDATSATPTNGIRATDETLLVTVQEGPSTRFRVSTLSPDSRYWDALLARFAGSLL